MYCKCCNTTADDGASSIAEVLKRMGIMPGKITMAAILKIDQNRLKKAEQKSSERVKMRRKKLRAMKKGLWDFNKEKEGIIYESGAF